MRYLVRLNVRAFNPITQKLDLSRVWEIEQCKTRDSGRIIWHGAEVNVNGSPIREFFTVPKKGDPAWEFECYGICVRGQDNALELHTTPKDASGN